MKAYLKAILKAYLKAILKAYLVEFGMAFKYAFIVGLVLSDFHAKTPKNYPEKPFSPPSISRMAENVSKRFRSYIEVVF